MRGHPCAVTNETPLPPKEGCLPKTKGNRQRQKPKSELGAAKFPLSFPHRLLVPHGAYRFDSPGDGRVVVMGEGIERFAVVYGEQDKCACYDLACLGVDDKELRAESVRELRFQVHASTSPSTMIGFKCTGTSILSALPISALGMVLRKQSMFRETYHGSYSANSMAIDAK